MCICTVLARKWAKNLKRFPFCKEDYAYFTDNAALQPDTFNRMITSSSPTESIIYDNSMYHNNTCWWGPLTGYWSGDIHKNLHLVELRTLYTNLCYLGLFGHVEWNLPCGGMGFESRSPACVLNSSVFCTCVCNQSVNITLAYLFIQISHLRI